MHSLTTEMAGKKEARLDGQCVQAGKRRVKKSKDGSKLMLLADSVIGHSPILALVLDLLMAGTVVIVQPDIVE